MCVCVCVCACVRARMHRCVHACMCVYVAKPVVVELRCHATALIMVDFLSVTLDHRVQCPRVGLGVKI